MTAGPVDAEPADIVEIAQSYADWPANSDLPKLFINAESGAMLTGYPREFCRTCPNQSEATVQGAHFVQEDSPGEVGQAIAK